jgi:hypothetical protein
MWGSGVTGGSMEMELVPSEIQEESRFVVVGIEIAP